MKVLLIHVRKFVKHTSLSKKMPIDILGEAVTEWSKRLPLKLEVKPYKKSRPRSSYDTSTGLFQEVDSRVIYINWRICFTIKLI